MQASRFTLGILRIAVALGVALVTGSLCSAWAQEPSPGRQDSGSGPSVQEGQGQPVLEGPESDVEPKSEDPRREPRFLPPRLRPRELTPEELAEAERVRKLAARFGTDPTAIVGRVQLSSQYIDLPQGARASETVARVDLAFRGNWLLRADAPFLRWSDPDRPGTTSAQGMSDLSVIAGWRAYNQPEYAFFIAALSTFPTAAESGLGLGKYTVGPLIASSRFLPKWDSFLFGVFQHQLSVGGDPARQAVEFTQASAQINTIWIEQWWTTVQGVWKVDWERNAKSNMTLEFEAGRNLGGGLGIFARPGVGIWGQDVPGAYDWNVEVGIRRTFPSF